MLSKLNGDCRDPITFQYARTETSNLSNNEEGSLASNIEKLSLNDTLVTYFYEVKRPTNTTSSMDAGADPKTWSISNVLLSDLIHFNLAPLN